MGAPGGCLVTVRRRLMRGIGGQTLGCFFEKSPREFDHLCPSFSFTTTGAVYPASGVTFECIGVANNSTSLRNKRGFSKRGSLDSFPGAKREVCGNLQYMLPALAAALCTQAIATRTWTNTRTLSDKQGGPHSCFGE